jgi:xanthine dehydrogenase YagR molybdenum-binding subunit
MTPNRRGSISMRRRASFRWLSAPALRPPGDVAAGFARAAKWIEATYQTPPQYHNAMEPHCVVAAWRAGRLSIDTPTQGLGMTQASLAGLFGVAPQDIEIRSLFVGGGFGSKGIALGPTALGVMAARLTGRPVKLVLRRDQMFGPVGHRAPTRQTLRLGADADGALTAISHHTKTASSTFDDFFEPASNASHTLYASPAIATSHEGVRLDTGTPLFMRAPGEAPGSAALECAIDEIAEACGMDPLAFRLKNYAEVEPMSGKPFSSKALRECYAQGAERFGWARRPRKPRQVRDENGLLVGWGLGTATFPAIMFKGHARATIHRDGRGVMEIGAHDMGQGASTALAQIAADSLGLNIDEIAFRYGATGLPDAGIAGGSAHTATAGMAIHIAGAEAIAELTDLATRDERSPLYGAGNAGVIARGGRLHRRDDEGRSESFAEILGRAGLAQVEGNGESTADPARAHYATHAHGAVFAEVKVDPELGQIRATRLVGAFAAGRVINPRLVRSQYYGGMIWGVSFALHERTIMDARSGRPMNANLAEYYIPTHADVPSLEALLIEEHDPHVNALGIKGVGEIGITGSVGAVANAVWHATGGRVRDFPITVDRLL